MKNIISKLVFTVMSIIGIFSFASNNITNVKAATNGGYALQVLGKSNDNVNIDNGSYVITGDPGQKVEVKLGIVNQESDTRTFLYNANTAYTTDNGNLGYDKTKVVDSSLKIQTRNIVTPNKGTISIPGKSTATVTATITVPKKSFDGYLMGGFNVSPYKEKAKGTVTSNGTLIKNKFSYSIPIQIHQTGKDKIEPKYSVRTVKPNTVAATNGKEPGVLANVHNSNNSYSGSLSAEAIVTKKGDKKFKITNKSTSQEIAPTSNYNYSISWGKKSLQAGDYHLKLTYKTAGGIKSWVLNKDFTITNSDAAKYNKLAGIKPNYMWLYILLAILALAIILGLGIYLGKKNNKNNGNNGGPNNQPTRRRRR
ncbi:DUF3324 domain-containing protein [Companilactobacillus sp. HBUAS59699]|uniref:DUF3324 domain-containing protein n=1 Tax=Companilactobacillus sp. HBUAS59699 TaxID=3109358 RepID=UPI002FF2D15F